MKNLSATTGSNNTSSSSAVDFPSKAEGIAVCSALALEAVLIVVGNLLTILLFAANKKLRKKSLFLVINMAFADVMLGAVSVPLYVYTSVGIWYQLWTANVHTLSLFHFYFVADTIFSQASIISAVVISCERFYAIYWPLKHRTLSMRAYRIVIVMVWTLAMLVSAVSLLPFFLISMKHATYAWMSFPLIFLFIVCGCNVGIWRKFQHGKVATQQQNRASQNQRLTNTLLFVSAIAVLSWFPLIIFNVINVHMISTPRRIVFYILIAILNFSNSFVNPIVYALRIPEFKGAVGLCCLRSQAALNREGNKIRDNRAAAMRPVIQLRTSPTDASHLHLSFSQQEVMNTKL